MLKPPAAACASSWEGASSTTPTCEVPPRCSGRSDTLRWDEFLDRPAIARNKFVDFEDVNSAVPRLDLGDEGRRA
jgi:hypothetical protein